MKPETMTTYITAADAAERADVSAATIYDWCAAGIIDSWRDGRRVLVNEIGLQNHLIRRARARRPRPRLFLIVNNT